MNRVISFLLIVFALFGGAFCASEKFNTINTRAEAASHKQVQAMHILVPTESQAVEIREEIMKGETSKDIYYNFVDAAKKYSKCPSGSSGGHLGWFGRGEMVPEFETAAFDLTPGQVSEPVKTQFGYHLIYVISKK